MHTLSRALAAVALVLALAPAVRAQTTTSSTTSTSTSSTTSTTPRWQQSGTFFTSRTTTGAFGSVVCIPESARYLTMGATIASTGTITLERQEATRATQQTSPRPFVAVGTALTATGETRITAQPIGGCYRVNVTVCTGCTITNAYWDWR